LLWKTESLLMSLLLPPIFLHGVQYSARFITDVEKYLLGGYTGERMDGWMWVGG
jgi:hypothetical protein